MRIGQRLTCSYSLIVLAIVLAGVFCLNIFLHIGEQRQEIKSEVVPNIKQTMHLYEALVDMDHWIVAFLLQGDSASYERAKATYLRIQTITENGAEDLGWPDANAADDLITQIQRYSSTVVNIARLKQEGRPIAEVLIHEGQPYHAHMNDMLRALGEHRQTLLSEINLVQQNLQNQEVQGWWAILLSTGLVIALALGTGLLVSHSITRPISHLQQGVQQLGQGDLSIRVTQPKVHELAELADTFNHMATQLQESTVSIDQLQQEITERQRTEAALEQARVQADTANQAKSQFLANISHEIRTPLNAILTMAQLLRRRDMDNLRNPQREGLDIIHWSGQQLLTLINSVLDLAKIEAGRMDVTYSETELAPLLSGLQNQAVTLIGDQPIRFHVQGQDQIPPSFVTDSAKLQIILTNIIGNAVKFTDQGEVTLSVTQSGTDWIFQVTDTGVGIAADKLNTVFDEFAQVDGSTTRRYSGTGLGLAIAKRMTELMNGTITIESTEGQGTTLTVTLPQVDQPAKVDITSTPSEIEPPSEIPSDTKVLIAEDDEFGRAALQLMLADSCQLSLAVDGHDAVAQAAQHNPDVIFLDIMMPELDGMQAFNEIRKKFPYTPIIALTAKALANDREQLLAHGFTDYLSKPIDEDKLLALIAQYGKR